MKLHFGRVGSDACMVSRLDGWDAENYPDGYIPAKIVLTVPGDKSGYHKDTGKMMLDARLVELEYVLVEVKRTPEHVPTDAYYNLSTKQHPIEPPNPLMT